MQHPMTQRERPLERVKEIGDTSVPFAFDVLMLITTQEYRRGKCGMFRRFIVRIDGANTYFPKS